ncbi:hypothetical protein DL95DRAFT_477455 [Leptodontidium sp. 2 PMI_412]|nr:hypothetical protein DL95DRAFT_477455 [Leptodontidium sp. 2 PMI_412]
MMPKMQRLSVFAMTVVFCFQAQLSAAYFGCWTLNGQEKLLGSSFGFPGANATFDYVIIGGGTSGLTVAVIEAGGFYEADAGNLSQIPADENIFSEAPVSIDWKITISPQSVGPSSHVLSTKDETSDVREATRRKVYIVSTGKMPRRIVWSEWNGISADLTKSGQTW